MGPDKETVLAGARPITNETGGLPRWPTWSPDGTRIAYSLQTPNRSDYRIMVARVDGGPAREVARIPFVHFKGLQWTGDGRSLIVAGRESPNWLGRIDLVTGRIERLVEHPTLAVATGPGELVAYVRPYVFIRGEMHMQVTVFDGGAAPRALATYPLVDAPATLSVSPDGQWLAVGRHIERGTVSVLELLPVSGGQPRTLLRLDRPDRLIANLEITPWTTDGGHVRVILRTGGETRLTTVDVETGEITSAGVVPLQGNVVGSIALSPDGRQVLYLQGRPRTELKVMLEP